MSFINNTRRAMRGRDYDNRDYDDEQYDSYEEERPGKGLFWFLRRDRDEDYYDEPAEEEAFEETEPESTKYRQSSLYSGRSTREASPFLRNRINSEASIRYGRELSGVELTVINPTGFNDSVRVVKEIKEGKIVVFDVSGIDEVEEARRVVDYISGAAEGMDCPFSRICPSIFCIAPRGVVINGKRTRF